MNIFLNAIEYASPEGIDCPELSSRLRKKIGCISVCVMVNAIDYLTEYEEGTQVNMRSGDSFIVTESIYEINQKLYATIVYPYN
jgi:hypothetical protein